MHLSSIDLNLLVVLQALLRERSVSRAAKRLGLSQSATSHALARLRDALGDRLFIRTSKGLVPTARAERMAESLLEALGTLERSLFGVPDFVAGTAERRFHVGTSDYTEHVLFSALLTRLAKEAPKMDLWSKPYPSDGSAALAQGELDLIIAPFLMGRESLQSVELWEDRFVCVARRGHPLLKKGKLTLEAFAEAQHAFIAPRGTPGGAVDDALEALGRSRRIAFSTPNFLVAPQVVARTDLVITLASRVAHAFAKLLPLTLFAPPLKLPGFRVSMFWHDRKDTDPAHRFLRSQVVETAKSLGDGW